MLSLTRKEKSQKITTTFNMQNTSTGHGTSLGTILSLIFLFLLLCCVVISGKVCTLYHVYGTTLNIEEMCLFHFMYYMNQIIVGVNRHKRPSTNGINLHSPKDKDTMHLCMLNILFAWLFKLHTKKYVVHYVFILLLFSVNQLGLCLWFPGKYTMHFVQIVRGQTSWFVIIIWDIISEA
jgi:hypothetical protein